MKIIHVGYITESKNQLMLLRALDILVNNFSKKIKVSFIVDFTDIKYKNTLDNFLINNQLEEHFIFEGFKENMNCYY